MANVASKSYEIVDLHWKTHQTQKVFIYFIIYYVYYFILLFITLYIFFICLLITFLYTN